MGESLSYLEKLENLYVLMETRSMLKENLSKTADEKWNEDLQKIEQEINSYSTGLSFEELEEKMTNLLFTPTTIVEMQEDENNT